MSGGKEPEVEHEETSNEDLFVEAIHAALGCAPFVSWLSRATPLDHHLHAVQLAIVLRECVRVHPSFEIPLSVHDAVDLSLLDCFHSLAVSHAHAGAVHTQNKTDVRLDARAFVPRP